MNSIHKCNIINFLRGANNLNDIDYMLKPPYEQLRLSKQYGLKTTFLLQYDALIDNRFIDLLKDDTGELIEIGAWLETPKQLVEAAGIKWRGRENYTWDWYCNVGFLCGYTPQERFDMIDIYFKKFFDIWGFFPASIGSWHIDVLSVDYIYRKYGIKACCICREQVGIDGYTLWGGTQPIYYPSRNNMFAPASTAEEQIDVPVFRMLGEDIIYNYDHTYLIEQMGYPNFMWHQQTMEPVSRFYGGNKKWADWFLKTQQDELNSPFTYVQIGQENSFGWDDMGEGYKMQIELINQMSKDGQISVEKLSETGEWYKEAYKSTPPVISVAQSDSLFDGRKSYWYQTAGYRANLYVQDKYFWIRDIYSFDEKYPERYIENKCLNNSVIYDNLPMVDGFLWSDLFTRCGIYPVKLEGEVPLKFEQIDTTRTDDNALDIKLETACGNVLIHFNDCITITSPKEVAWIFKYSKGDEALMSKSGDSIDAWNSNIISWDKKAIHYSHNGYSYALSLTVGEISEQSKNGNIIIIPGDGEIKLNI
ncbi:MAG: hypothetical protein ACI4F7_07775 [Acutalibacteraceae bacterium]